MLPKPKINFEPWDVLSVSLKMYTEYTDRSQKELIDKLHRQARVEEEVKHVLKAYYKHRDIDKEEYKSILRRAVPQVCHSDPYMNLH